MKRLYIIGNGFDLFFDLPTTTDDFCKELDKIIVKDNESARTVFESHGVDWSIYETGLSKLDLEDVSEDVVESPSLLAEHQYEVDEVILKVKNYTEQLLDAKNQALINMVKNSEKIIDNIKDYSFPEFFSSENDEIISFNYTSTIESLFNYNRRVFHIHGYYKGGNNLIFGYGKESDSFYSFCSKLNSKVDSCRSNEIERIINDSTLTAEEKVEKRQYVEKYYEQYPWNDYEIDKQYEILVSFYCANKKQKQLERLEEYLRGLEDINEIVVLGQGMGEVDHDYFCLIDKYINPIKWIVSAKDYSSINGVKSICDKYPFKDKITIRTMKDILGIYNCKNYSN